MSANDQTKEQLQLLRIGMEATSNLEWYHLKSELQGYDTISKNDRIDAWMIEGHLQYGRLR
jgi:hypothetical protein